MVLVLVSRNLIRSSLVSYLVTSDSETTRVRILMLPLRRKHWGIKLASHLLRYHLNRWTGPHMHLLASALQEPHP